MRPLIVLTVAALTPLAGAASATTLQPSPGAGGYRAAAVDPDARLEGLAAASSHVRGDVHGRPSHARPSIIKDDPQLRAAFAWLGNK